MAAAAKKRSKRPAFSTVKAVKHNARTVVGQPAPSRVLPQKPSSAQPPRFRPSLAERLNPPADES